MTEEKLSTAQAKLADVQKEMLALVEDSNTVLIGHSLVSDLRALKLAHPRCIDTSVVFHHTRGPPSKPSLKWLAQKWLGREIQMIGGTGDRIGHDPKEDAQACVDLIHKKLNLGMDVGLQLHDAYYKLRAMVQVIIMGGLIGKCRRSSRLRQRLTANLHTLAPLARSTELEQQRLLTAALIRMYVYRHATPNYG